MIKITNKICGIYIIKNKINNKVYIGQSKDIYKRWRQHKAELNRNARENGHLQNAWNKYGKDNFKFKTIEKCSADLLNKREIYWMEKYNSFDSKCGYNKTTGGMQGKVVSEETKKKISDKNQFIHRGEKNTNAKYTDKQVRLCKMLAYCYMKTEDISDITGIPPHYVNRIKLIEAWGHVLEDYNDEIKRISHLEVRTNSRPIIMFDKKFNIVRKFQGVQTATDELNLSFSCIYSCCNMNSVMAYEHIWLFDNADLEENIKKKKEGMQENNEFLIHKIDSCGNVLETFNTGAEAAKKYNIDSSTLLKYSKKEKQIRGHVFKREYLYA